MVDGKFFDISYAILTVKYNVFINVYIEAHSEKEGSELKISKIKETICFNK